MSKTPFMPLWVSDFLADTTELDAAETGAYLLILMAMWQRGGTLPNDQAKLRRVARVGRGWPKIWDAINGYFRVEEGQIFNARLTAELTKARTKSEVNSRNGARGGRAKSMKNKDTGLANASNSLKQPYPEPEVREKEDTNVSYKKSDQDGLDLRVVDGAADPPPKQKPKRRTRIPDNAVPSDADERAWLKRELPMEDLTHEYEQFKNYHISRGTLSDRWDRYWITWLDHDKYGVVAKRNQRNGSRDPRQAERVRAAAEYAASHW